MQLHWDALIQGITAGVVGAGVIALLTLSRNRVREQLLKRQIRRELDTMGIGTTLDGVTTSVRNQTGREMTVRQITFVMNATHFVLLPTGELTSSYKRENPKLTGAEIRRLKKGENVQMKIQMQFRSWKVPPGLAGFVTLPPYTKTSFVLPARIVVNSDKPITGIRIVLEYATRSGEKKILHHDVKSRNLEHLQSTVDHFREEARSGKLNEARKISQMPEISLKLKPNAPTETPEKGP